MKYANDFNTKLQYMDDKYEKYFQVYKQHFLKKKVIYKVCYDETKLFFRSFLK